ncbi:MAG: cysteine desulfurase family protein [Candidatus Buchananbacteria bacterium]|nr:cysteine desulfurase family protein [Candidatus Buchananbacteria bacterium]
MKHNIYFDNAATTKVDPAVLSAMLPYFSDEYGNASSLHYAGLNNRVVVDRSQAKIADFLGCDKSEVYFTSGATESDNMAILGVTEAINNGSNKAKRHVITTKIEHDAILEPCRELEKMGVKVTYLTPNQDGLVTAEKVKAAIEPETVLVSIMYVNNEIGTILPIGEIGRMITQLNSQRENKIYFHTDATQALNFLDCNVEALKVDLLSLSGHKIYGPKGIGAIYIRRGTPFKPITFGGHQQAGVRPGTYNVPAVAGLAEAVNSLSDKKTIDQQNDKIKELRDYIIKQVLLRITGSIVTGTKEERSPNNASFVFEGVKGEDIVLSLSEKGLAVSTGSACSSGSLDPSHVLLALGLKPELAHGSLRVSLSKYNTENEAKVFVEELEETVSQLRKIMNPTPL